MGVAAVGSREEGLGLLAGLTTLRPGGRGPQLEG